MLSRRGDQPGGHARTEADRPADAIFELDLKTERKRRKKQTVTVLPAREDSLDRLAENGGYPYTPADVSVEDALIERDELERLRCALRELRMDEWMLVNALYYQGISETEAAKILNVTQQAVSYRIKAICRKLKKIMEK